jgi:hypothetical protein
MWFEERSIPWPDHVLNGRLDRDVVEVGIPELAGNHDMTEQLAGDLARAGMTTSGLGGMMSPHGLKAKRTTTTGTAFLRFISDPRGGLEDDTQDASR